MSMQSTYAKNMSKKIKKIDISTRPIEIIDYQFFSPFSFFFSIVSN